MGKIKLPEKVKLFTGIIGWEKNLIEDALKELEKTYGVIDLESDFFDFNLTSYYNEEMGEILYKKFYSFKNLIDRGTMPDIKIKTNELEENIKIDKDRSGRDLNLDPGYITLVNVTLATTKDYRHRIYIGKGIFLENTLYYDGKKKTFTGWDWTYPDFRTAGYIKFFNEAREIYHNQLKSGE